MQVPALPMAGVVRRFGAMISDSLIAFAVMLIATLPFLPFLHGKVLNPKEVGWLAYAYRVWQLVVVALFFGFFWTRNGQTVGMLAWRIRVEDESGSLLTWRQALQRWLLAALPWVPSWYVFTLAEQSGVHWLKRLALGLLSVGLMAQVSLWFRADRRTWHDCLSHSRVIVVSGPRK